MLFAVVIFSLAAMVKAPYPTLGCEVAYILGRQLYTMGYSRSPKGRVAGALVIGLEECFMSTIVQRVVSVECDSSEAIESK